MPASHPRTRILRSRSETTDLLMARRTPHPLLRPYVRDLCGYSEKTPGLLQRREFPGPQIVVVLELGPPIRVSEAGELGPGSRHAGGFAAGICDRFTLTAHDGFQCGVQLDLTPGGARRFFGIPMSELAGRAVSLRDLLPTRYRDLDERLAELPSWDARLDQVETLLLERLQEADVATQITDFAQRRIEACGGAIEMGALARELGYSRKHVIHLFREHVGVTPKLLARIIRFDRLMQYLRSGRTGRWSELALAFGYYDQSHLVRDVQQFTGTTPTAARASLVALEERPDGDVNSIQAEGRPGA